MDIAYVSTAVDHHSQVQAILQASDIEMARMLLKKTLDAYEKKAPRVMKILEEGFDGATAVLTLPERYRRRLRTTSSAERGLYAYSPTGNQQLG